MGLPSAESNSEAELKVGAAACAMSCHRPTVISGTRVKLSCKIKRFYENTPNENTLKWSKAVDYSVTSFQLNTAKVPDGCRGKYWYETGENED